jgi:hypothetical protein
MDETTRRCAGILPASHDEAGKMPALLEEAPVHPEVQYEPSDASMRWVLVFAGSLLLLGAVVFVSLLWLFRFMVARDQSVKPPPSVLAVQLGQLPPEPRLEGLVSFDELYGMPAAQQLAASKYGWVDQKQSIISIPVEQAMESIPAATLKSSQPLAPEPPRPSSSNSGRILPVGQASQPAKGGQP